MPKKIEQTGEPNRESSVSGNATADGLEESALSQKTATEKSFEQALAELEGLVQKLERGELSLEESMQAYEEGVKLTALCNNRLKNARLKIEELRNTPNEE